MSAKPTTKPNKKTAPSQRTRKPAAKPVRKACGTPGPTGQLTKGETSSLLLQAKDAFQIQSSRGRVDPGMDFNEWRRDMVSDRVGLAGISQINRSHWRDVMAMFLELADREDEAFALLGRTGTKSYRPVNSSDTWETCEQFAALVRSKLAAHAQAVATHEKGHIREGWFLAAARQRTNKPTLTMNTLAERLDPDTLHGLLSHLGNHIALREGRAKPERRGKRSYPKKANSGEMENPF